MGQSVDLYQEVREMKCVGTCFSWVGALSRALVLARDTGEDVILHDGYRNLFRVHPSQVAIAFPGEEA